VGAAIGAAGGLFSAGLNYFGSQRASQQQVDAQGRAITAQTGMFDTARNALQPYIDAGTSALDPLKKLLTPGASMTDTLSKLPGFQFAQDWGQKAVSNLGSTLGFGGNTLKAGAEFATGTAQQGFGSLVNMLQNYANMGKGSADTLAGTATTTGANIGNSLVGQGNAAAAGTLGGANALSGGFGGLGNAGLLYSLGNRLNQNQNNNNPGVYENMAEENA
jgi:hypothetical protein